MVTVYSRIQSGYHIGDIVNILLKPDLDQRKVCTVQPLGVMENSCFVVDVDAVEFQDLKADDLGAWSTTGTKKSFFRFTPSGNLRVTERKPGSQSSEYYTLTRRYYVHKSYDKFHRQLVDIKGMLTGVVVWYFQSDNFTLSLIVHSYMQGKIRLAPSCVLHLTSIMLVQNCL